MNEAAKNYLINLNICYGNICKLPSLIFGVCFFAHFQLIKLFFSFDF